jgi:8-oxo-dGTP pyrophosphatase MutT (NUDIX family)
MNLAVSDPRPEALPPEPPPRDAASVVLLRPGSQGLEVLLLRRHQRSGVLGGLYVFPGGKLDPDDCADHWQDRLDLPLSALHARLNEPQTPPAKARGLHVAALRELLEEASVDLGGRVASLCPWSRWITPRNPPVGTPRFDTRFFLALMPPGQEAQHDNHEAVESVWLTPQEGLRRYWAGEIGLIPPQLMALAHLARHPSPMAAWQAAQARRAPCIEPFHFQAGEVRAMCYPGDPLHPVAERALPGPTRLRWVAQRFEPFDGFEGWFR